MYGKECCGTRDHDVVMNIDLLPQSNRTFQVSLFTSCDHTNDLTFKDPQ